MRKQVVRLGTSLAVAAAALVFGSAAFASGNFDPFIGQKELDTDFGSGRDMEEQDALGIFTDWGGKDWPVHIAVDALWGNQDTDDDDLNTSINGSTGEFGVGVRWYPAKGSRWMPHLGGGAALVSGEVRVNDEDPNDPSDDFGFDDSKLGYWTDAGLAYRIGDHFKAGGRVRYSRAELDNPVGAGESVDVEAGGLTYGVNVGWTW